MSYFIYPLLSRLKLLVLTVFRLSFLDRTNIGNARLANLEADLGMKGLNYNVCGFPSTLYHLDLSYLLESGRSCRLFPLVRLG